MAEEAKRATTGGEDAGQQAPPVRVLVVEEDRVEGGMLAFHLRREGLVVMLAGSGDEAIDALAWAPPDAIMVEAHGRELDGFEVIRALGDTPVRVFLLSDGLLDLEDELEALRLGVTDVFSKPVDPALVARRVLERPISATRGSIPDLPDNGISGDLAVHPVAHLLSLCHRHRMNARLHVELDGDWGVLLIRHGDVIDAESPGATGRDAAFAAIRRAEGTFVLFPLDLDAEELTRDDVVRADVATLFTEALGRPPTRQFPKIHPDEQHVIEIDLPARESPRGPLSRPAVRRPTATSNDTLEYEASPSEPAAPRSPGPETRARIQRQVGIPVDDASRQPLEVSTAPRLAPAPGPETPPSDAQPRPRGHDRSDNVPRRRVTTGAQVRERASQIRRPTRPMPISSPPMEPVRPEDLLSTPPPREPTRPPEQRPSTRPPEARPSTQPPQARPATWPPEPQPGTRPPTDRPGTRPPEARPATRPPNTRPEATPRGLDTQPPAPRPPDTRPPSSGWSDQSATTVAGFAPVDEAETTLGQDPVVESSTERAALPADVLETLPAGAHPPELPASARVVRPATSRAGTEPDIDEPTDISDKHPLTDAPRVRRPSTGMFRIGDEKAPKERTDVDVQDAPVGDDTLLGAPDRPSRLHWSVIAMTAALVALLVFVVVRAAAGDEPPPPAPDPIVEPLDLATQAKIRFGEAAQALRLGEDGEAQRLFEQLVGDADRPDGALAGLAMIYLKEGKIDDAEPVLEALNRKKQGDPRVLAWLGLVHAKQGRLEEAKASFHDARDKAEGPLADRLDELLATFE